MFGDYANRRAVILRKFPVYLTLLIRTAETAVKIYPK